MNTLNKKSLFLFLLLSTTSIVPLAQAGGVIDNVTGAVSGAWSATSKFAVSTGTNAYNYVRNAPTTITSGTWQQRAKLGGIAAAAVATPFVLVYLIKRLKAKPNSGGPKSS